VTVPPANTSSSASPQTQAIEKALIYARASSNIQSTLTRFGIADSKNVAVTAPVIPERIRLLTFDQVRDLEDALIRYRDDLTKELCQCRGLELPAAENVAATRARVMRAIQGGNADSRRAEADTDGTFMSANAEHVTLRGVRFGLETRLEQIDIQLERLKQEFFLKQRLESAVPAPRALPAAYKAVGTAVPDETESVDSAGEEPRAPTTPTVSPPRMLRRLVPKT